ncbi:DUF6511 domain-containing protein [Brucella sp. IR073]|uniref:DUF6511 domain-containing protein n=1 Tax=unclassified Brucella TaxID=2632610 RepID=UPI003B98479E
MSFVDRSQPGLCAVCARREVGIGYSSNPRQNLPVLWVCDDPECIAIAKDTYFMKQDQFDRIESLAAGKGGQRAGGYLEEIGKTDLKTLTVDEWHEFCRRLVAGYRNALKEDLKNEAAF